MGTANVAGISFELSFDGSKMMSSINSSCRNIRSKFEQSFTNAGQSATKSISSSNEKIKAILSDTEKTAKSKAASIAAVYRNEGDSAEEAFRKAWSHIERDSAESSGKVKKHFFGMRSSAKNTASKIEKDFGKSFNTVSSLAKKTGAILASAFAVKKIVDFGKSCLELGSDLSEVQNVVDVTFPSMTAQVDKFAKSAAQSFGLSETMAKKFTSMFGTMARQFGFSEQAAYDMGTTLAGLAGDVASFYNMTQDEAYTKLKAVFSGETEVLKDIGIVMTQTALDAYAMANGFGKTIQQMSEAEKVALRYAFVQNQLTAATRDFARTSDSWENQVRIMKLQMDSLKATLGQGLINLFTPVIKVINTVLGKLSTLANAFKSFTELITGKKSQSGKTAAPVAELGGAASTASESLDRSASAANGLSKATKGVGNAAKKAAKEMRALMGFDQINRLDDTSSDNTGDTSSPSTGGGSGFGGSAVDFGSLAQGETVIDQTDKKISALIKRCKELAEIFKNGFRIGFGDSEKKIKSINKGLKNIKKTLKEIATDSYVANAADKWADSFVLAFGKITGSAARIGLTIADNLIGGIDKYLSKNKNWIKRRIISLFDVTSEIQALAGDLSAALAEIFDVFSGSDAKGITADIIGIFSDGFLGVTDLGLRFVRDILKLVVFPVIDNVQKIKTVFENALEPIRIVLDTIYSSVQQTFQKIFEVYDTSIKPFFDSVSEGISHLLGIILDGYNTYIAPVLDYLAEKFSSVWKEHIQPALNGIVELLGKIFENLKALWETALVPFIEWIVNTIMPVLGPILMGIGDLFLDLLSVAGDVVSGITDILGGFLDFCTGVFKGDFDLCWQGIGQILEDFKKIADSVFSFVKKYVFTPFSNYIKNIFETDWSKSFGVLGEVLNTFLSSVKRIWKNIKDVFTGIVDFVKGAFTSDWERAWEGVKNIFGGIFDNLITLAKTPLNCVIDIINSLIGKLNAGLSAIENAFSFNYDFKNPFTGTRYQGHYGLSLPSVSTIPHLAQGGYVKKNAPQLAMIGDNRHQGEVVAPEDKLREMAMEAVRAAGNGFPPEVLAILKQILELLLKIKPVTIDEEALRKYFIEKTNAVTKSAGKCEIKF